MKYNKRQLIKSADTFNYIPFYGYLNDEHACFSNWFNCVFVVDHIIYHTTEQYMMAQKAMLFNDYDTLNKIMSAKTPKEYKQLGRQVKNFNSEIWNQAKYEIIKTGCLAKFSQNTLLKDCLLNTGNSILVEAAPRDLIWGVGLGKNNEKITNPSEWRGQNLLGFALMEVRDNLRDNIN